MRPELESIYRTAPIGLGVLDRGLRFERVNDRLAEMNGLPAEAHIGRTVGELLPDLAKQAEAVLRRVLETGEPVRDIEIRGTTPAQPGVERIWIEQFTPLCDADGRVTRLSVVAEEVTQRRRAEEALRRSQERLQVALEAGRMAVWDWTPGSDTVFEFMQRVHGDDRAKLDAEIARALAKGGDYEAEFRTAGADGEMRWLASRGRVLHEGDERRSRLVGVNFDITERKLIEQAMKEGDARRTEFLAMLAHELRNPLAPITNAVRLLELVGDAPEHRKTATQILRRQAAQMARLVDDLLEVSRITQGRIELRMENVLVATSVFQAVEAARPQARDNGQEIDVEVPPALDVVADPTRLTQIISNLVTNAVKYTQDGGRIEVLVEDEADDVLSIAVQDNGPGISPDLRSRIFELFTQDKRTLDRAQGGLGIGLALVKQLSELHGGHVRYENRKDGVRGARFVVCLPRKGRREELRGSSVTATHAHLPPMPMLVVDDNQDAAQTLAALLHLDGHRVEVAYDGEEALATAIGLRPKVVVLDLGLPKLDGLAVARRLRQDARFGPAVLIAMSGYAQAADREATRAAGFDAHLAKPLELPDLYAAIEEALA